MPRAFCILAGLSLALAPAASAQAQDFYISAFGGLNFQEDQDSVRVADSELSQRVKLDFDPGTTVGGSLGYALPLGFLGRFRLELEGAYRENDLDTGSTLAGEQAFSGDQSAISGLAMLYYDLADIPGLMTPYLGAGAGVASIDSDVAYAPAGGDPDAPTVRFGGDSQTELAWQVVAGFRVPLVLGLELTLDGRYFAATDPDFARRRIDTGAQTGRFDSEFESWTVTGGFRWTF